MIVRTLLTPSGKTMNQRLGIDERWHDSGFRPTIKHTYSVDDDRKCIGDVVEQIAFECPYVGKASVLLAPIAKHNGITIAELLERLRRVDWSVYGLTCNGVTDQFASIVATGYEMLPTTVPHWRTKTGLPMGMAIATRNRQQARRDMVCHTQIPDYRDLPSAV